MTKVELDTLEQEARPLLHRNIILKTSRTPLIEKVYCFVDIGSIGISENGGEMRYDAYGKLVSIENKDDYKTFSLWAIVHAIKSDLPLIILQSCP